MAGSTGRERELACIKKLAEDHCGCSAELASALHEIRMDGPKKEEEIASRFSGQDEVTENCRSQQLPEGLCLAPFGKKFAQIWLQRYGRRFRVYKERRDRGVKRGHRQFSEAHLVSQQRHGRDLLVEGKGADKELLGQGLSKANVAVPATDRQKRYRFSEVLGQFRKRRTVPKRKWHGMPTSTWGQTRILSSCAQGTCSTIALIQACGLTR